MWGDEVEILAAVAVFLLGVFTYRQGFKDGLAVSRGGVPQNPVREAVKAVREIKVDEEVAKQEKAIADALESIFTYDGKAGGTD